MKPTRTRGFVLFAVAAALAFVVSLLAWPGDADAQRRKRKRRGKKPAAAAPATPDAPGDPAADAGDKNDRDKNDSKKNGKAKVFDFTGLELGGRMRTPQLLYFLDRANEELDRASLEKRSFIPEMTRSMEDEGL